MLPKKTKTTAAKGRKRSEIDELRARLAEAEETLEAIRTGAVDAIVVCGQKGDQVYTLQGADQSYRLLVESISEGFVTLSPDGTILYCNRQFADMVGISDEKLIGSSFLKIVSPEDRHLFQEFLSSNVRSVCRYRVVLKSAEERDLYTQVSLGYTEAAGSNVVTAIVSNLTEQLRYLNLIKEEGLSPSIINQVPVGIAVCDREGIVIRSSPALRTLCNQNVQGETF